MSKAKQTPNIQDAS